MQIVVTATIRTPFAISRITYCFAGMPLSSTPRRAMSSTHVLPNGDFGASPRKLKILMLHGMYLSLSPSCVSLFEEQELKSPVMHRIHPIWSTLPRQNPRPRKSPDESLPTRLPKQSLQASAQTTKACTWLSTLVSRRCYTDISIRGAQAQSFRGAWV